MKNIKMFTIGLIVGVVMMLGTFAFADAPQIAATIRADFGVSLNGHAVKLNHDPVIVNGSMYLPLKDIAAIAGLNVKWDDKTSTAVLSNTADSTSRTTNDGLSIVTFNGVDYISVHDISMKYYDKGYDMKFDLVNKTVALVFNPENGHPIDKYQVVSNYVSVTVINDASHITLDDYNNLILPKIK